MFEEIWSTYLDCLRTAWPQMAAGAVTLGSGVAAGRSLRRAAEHSTRASRVLHVVPWIILAVAITLGTSFAAARASVFDDAFISFRFVENLLHGHGLVWNLNERVEGYTNFLWVMIVAALSKISALPPAEVGLWASLAVFPCNLLVTFKLERTLALAGGLPGRSGTLFVPVATLLLALQDAFLSAGTSGLETGFGALLVAAGVVQLVRADSPRDWGLTGLWLILATLTRPDHAIFYAVASGWLVYEEAGSLLRDGRPALRLAMQRMLAFAAPFALYGAHTAWRFAFYGEFLPNTYYVKAADGSYFEQGAAYAGTFYLGSHLWVLIPVVLGYVIWPARSNEERRFKRFLGAIFIVYNAYVLKVGGDFMYGRFYVTLLPLITVALARAVLLATDAAARWRWGVVLAATLGATVGGVAMIKPGQIRWGICDERTMYGVKTWHPLTIDHSNFRVGNTLRGWRDEGLNLRVSTSGIGMIGYYSRMEVIDLMGLTDKHVARQPLTHRGRPGHEKRASRAYIAKRMPHIVRGTYSPRRHEELTRLRFPASVTTREWFLYHYDREVMARIKELPPRVKYTRFDSYLKRYIKRDLRKRTPKELDEDDRFFRRFYFDHNDDPELLESWERALKRARDK